MKKIVILFGGNSYEHDISIKSGLTIIENIDKSEFDVSIVYISKDNIWYKYNGFNSLENIENIIEYLKQFDGVFNIIHGNDGEDGKLQSMFELFNIKYVGPNNISSTICMNKDLTKIVLKENKIKQVKYVIYNNNINDIIKVLKFPMIVKPSNGGSSIGISKVNDALELKCAIKEAKKYCEKVIVEEFIKAMELEVAVLETNGKLLISNVGRIIPGNDFYDYDDKYVNSKFNLEIPANIKEEISSKIKSIAKKAFTSCGCKGLSRIDFFYDEDNDKIYLNEINTLPGFTNISMFPKLLNYEGFTTKEIITLLINNSINS